MSEKDTFDYSSRHLESFFGISRKVLHYWRKIGLLSSGIKTKGGHYRYKFIDLVAIKTIIKIRDEGISTYKIKKVVMSLNKHFPALDVPLAEKSFYVLGKEVMATDKKGSFNPLTGQCTFIKNSDIRIDVKKIALNKFDIPTSSKKVS
jgi:DNA-binding transcriptional MerR regulator